MRWTFICCLLMTVAVITAAEQNNTKTKRDVSFIKDFFFSKLFGGGEENQTAEPSKVLIRQPVSFRLIQIPSAQKFETKDTAQNVVNVVESQSFGGHPSIAIVSSYLGTNTLNETLDALKGVRTLLQSGVLSAKHDRVSPNIVPVTLNYATPSLVPSTSVESGKVVVEVEKDEQNFPHVLNSVVPIPLQPYGQLYPVKEQRPQRVPFPVYPTHYSYKQVYNDRVNSYNANSNHNVIVTESKNPIPLPHYIGQRFQEILALGVNPIQRVEPQAPVASVNINIPSISAQFVGIPKAPLNIYKPVKVQPSPSGYSYQHLHNDGTVTTYTGTGLVEEQKIELPAPIAIEIPKPLPIQNIHIDRTHSGNSLHSATGGKPPTPTLIKESFYGRPGLIYQEPYPIVVHRIPGYVPISSDHIKNEANLIHNVEHQMPHQLRPVIVHQDFNSEIRNKNSSSKVEIVKHQQTSFNGSMDHNKSVSSAFAYNFVNDRHRNNMPNKVKIVCKDDSHTSHILDAHNAVHAQLGSDAKRGGYFYTAVHKDGSITRYSGTDETKEHTNVHLAQPVAFVSAVTEKVVIDKNVAYQPLVSQYVYKQINHHSPEGFTVVNLDGIRNGDSQVNVQVGTQYSSTHVTPNPNINYASSNSHPSEDISKIPNEYLFIPPKSTKDLIPTMNYNVTKNYSQSFTQLTNQGVYTNRDGSADFLSQTSVPVPKVSKFSTSTSIPSTASSTISTSSSSSLSANPIVVLPNEDTFSYTQNKADGGIVKIHGSLNKVSVVDNSATNSSKHRGDIPDTFL